MRLVAATLFIAASYSCSSDATGPGGRTPGIHIVDVVAGDTVDATPTQALVVQVNDSTGSPVHGAVVRFETVPDNYYYFPRLLLMALASSFNSVFVADTTNVRGRAAVLVRMGQRAGTGHVAVSAPEFGFTDTVEIEVKPGNVTHVRFNVADTAMFVDGSVALAAVGNDRYDNPRSEAAALSTLTPSVCSVSGSTASAKLLGKCLVQASLETYRDTAQVAVVPRARLVVLRAGNALGLVNTDGTAYRKLRTVVDYSLSPVWAPDGSKIAMYEGDPGGSAKLSVIDTLGTRLASVGAGVTMQSASVPHFSADGQWIYFTGEALGEYYLGIWRMHPDMTARERMLDTLALQSLGPTWRPNPSPDGQKVLFDAGEHLYVMDVATRNVTPFNVRGIAGSFSPDGSKIAFLGGPGYSWKLMIMDADGSNMQSVGSDSDYNTWQSPQWSADGQWVFARSTYRFVLIKPSTGEEVPLSSSLTYDQGQLAPPFAH